MWLQDTLFGCNKSAQRHLHSAMVLMCSRTNLEMSPWPHCVPTCWTLYMAVGTFVVEQRHGFNKQTPLLFLKDQIKTVSLHSLTTVVAQQLEQVTFWRMLSHKASSE